MNSATNNSIDRILNLAHKLTIGLQYNERKYQCVKRKQIWNGSEQRVSSQGIEVPFVMTKKCGVDMK